MGKTTAMKFIRADVWSTSHPDKEWTNKLKAALLDEDTLDRFIHEVLVPSGHAKKVRDEYYWYFSTQFYDDIYNRPEIFEPLIKLTQ